jgi:hypothetical protein
MGTCYAAGLTTNGWGCNEVTAVLEARRDCAVPGKVSEG